MLTRLAVRRYKSLYDVSLDLEPLTVFIGPNGSGKSNICESLVLLSDFHLLSSSFEGNSFANQNVTQKRPSARRPLYFKSKVPIASRHCLGFQRG